MKTFSTLKIDIQSHIATVWLNRPEVHNAINSEMLDELLKCFNLFENDDYVRLVVLRGKGKSFSSGADLKKMLESTQHGFDENYRDGLLWGECLNKIYNLSKPLITIATGNVYGGGNGLLSVSDIVIAETNTFFSFPEVKIGLAPSTILPYVLTRLTEYKAKYLMFTGRRINAFEALEYNLVDFVVNGNEIETKLEEITTDIIYASPNAVREVKIMIRKFQKSFDTGEVKKLAAKSIAKLKGLDDAQKRIAAFLEKSSPARVQKK